MDYTNPPPAHAPTRVLIAEDDGKIASFMGKALRGAGFAVNMMHRGDEALTPARANTCRAFVFDIRMPGIDGLSVVRRLRGRLPGKATPRHPGVGFMLNQIIES